VRQHGTRLSGGGNPDGLISPINCPQDSTFAGDYKEKRGKK
jgi:hypothetical protein